MEETKLNEDARAAATDATPDLDEAIYAFINSPACAEHCRRIGHRFNAVEKADILLRSNRPFAERHRLLKALLAAGAARAELARYTNISLQEHDKTLPEYIEAITAYKRTGAQHFLEPEKDWAYLPHRDDFRRLPGVFAALPELLRYAHEYCVDFPLRVMKLRVGMAFGPSVTAIIDEDGSVRDIACCVMHEDEDYLLELWPSPIENTYIPTPFVRGDIVLSYGCNGNEPAVVDCAKKGREAIYTLDRRTTGVRIEREKVGWVFPLSDYHLFSGELPGRFRTLNYLSDLLKGQIHIDEYEDAVRAIETEGDSKMFLPDEIVI